jgi:hypothetical protein
MDQADGGYEVSLNMDSAIQVRGTKIMPEMDTKNLSSKG